MRAYLRLLFFFSLLNNWRPPEPRTTPLPHDLVVSWCHHRLPRGADLVLLCAFVPPAPRFVTCAGVLSFLPAIAPHKCSVLPLTTKTDRKVVRKLAKDLLARNISAIVRCISPSQRPNSDACC